MGIFNWSKKKASSIKETGKKVIGTEEIKNNANFIISMSKKLFSPKEIIENAKEETFLEAKQRLNVNDMDLVNNYKNYSRSFYASVVGALICLSFFVINLVNVNIMGAFATLSILSICLANAFKFSFRAFQIKHQKLCPIKDWLDRPSEWFPPIC